MREIEFFLAENQHYRKTDKKFSLKCLWVMEKAVFLQPQIARYSVAKTEISSVK